MSRQWQWNTDDAEWSVVLDAQANVLHWRGVDKPRPGVPAYAQGGGEVDQRTWDLLTTGRPAYECPPEILVDVFSAARAALPRELATTPVRIPPLANASIERVLRALQVAMQRLTGATSAAPQTVKQLLVEDVPDDRPTQSSGTRYITGVWLGDRTFVQCTEEVGGWFRGSRYWWTVDFAGKGPLQITFDDAGVEIASAPNVVDVLSNALLMNTSPEDDDLAVHQRAHAIVRDRFASKPEVVWEVEGEWCREGALVSGRASHVAYDLYLALLPTDRWFILHIVDIDAVQ